MFFVVLWGGAWSVAISRFTYGVLDKANIGALDNFFGAVFVIGPVEEAAKFLASVSRFGGSKKNCDFLLRYNINRL